MSLTSYRAAPPRVTNKPEIMISAEITVKSSGLSGMRRVHLTSGLSCASHFVACFWRRDQRVTPRRKAAYSNRIPACEALKRL